jgi:hypothetical protein
MTTTVSSPAQFAQDILAGLDAPETQNNIETLVGWWEREGGAGPQFGVANNIASYNPFNTSLPEPGSQNTPGNPSAPIQAYTSWDQGIAATLSTLEEPRYAAIVSDLKANAPEQDTAAAVGASPWGTPDWDPGGTAPTSPTAGTSTSASATSPSSATLTSFPGGDLDPLNWVGGVAASGGKAIASGILGVIDTITAPLTHFLEDSALVLFGIIIVIVALVLIAHAGGKSDDGSATTGVPLKAEAEEGAEDAAVA